MKLSLTLDSIAILLYCSELYYSDIEPFDDKEWDYLEKKIKRSQIKTPAGLMGLNYDNLSILLDVEDDMREKIISMNSHIGELFTQLSKLEDLGIGIVTKYENNYPRALKDKLKKKAPNIIYYIGNYELMNNEAVYLTGPIKSDSHINSNTKVIADHLLDEDYTLITSNSRGVESLAVNQYLKSGGKVIEFSCENILNSKKQNAKAIKNGQMLILSARHPFATFDLVKAIDRNQYIYCLSKLAIIVYSSINSGATWLSAIQNINNHYTTLAAVVDDEFYGNARLIELGAKALTMDMFNSAMSIEEMCEEVESPHLSEIYYDQLSIYDFLE